MTRKNYLISVLIVLSVTMGGGDAAGVSPEVKEQALTFDAFLKRAAEKDTEFEEILIDELTLRYQKALTLPAGDIVLSVKEQYEFFYLDESEDRSAPDTTVSLSKLFPYTGTELTADYQVGTSLTSTGKSSEASFSISQPIAQNAFGHYTRMRDRIVGLENDVSRYQIIEAYEDYLAVVAAAYYNWFEDYENLQIGRDSYEANMQLLDDIYERRKQKIAQPVDVNKVKLQVMSKEERLIELEEQYRNSLNIIKRMIRYEENARLVPVAPDAIGILKDNFEACFTEFHQESRTFKILDTLEKKSTLEVARDADALLPSIHFLIGYEVSGSDYVMEGGDTFVYGGLELEWPFTHQVERAQYEVTKILERRTRLSTMNTYHQLYAQLSNLYLQLRREKKLIDITDTRIELAEAVLEDEAENYSFGKVSLNDYIQAVNALDANRFNKVLHEALYKRLLVEWFRLTDQLVKKGDVLKGDTLRTR